MRQRCENPNDEHFPDYGGRGISVCERWLSFENFVADMGPRPSPRHTIDRIEVNGNYEPVNCRWATATMQNRNKRTTLRVEWRGETRCATEWAKVLGIPKGTLFYRLSAGWPVERAFTEPAKKGVRLAVR